VKKEAERNSVSPVRDASQLKRNKSAAVEPSAIKYMEDLFICNIEDHFVGYLQHPFKSDTFISYVVRIITIVIFFILLFVLYEIILHDTN